MKVLKKLIVLVWTPFFLIFLSEYCEGVEIVTDGKPRAKIVIASDACRMLEYAAKELQTYVEKITGAKLPIEKVGSEEKVTINKNENYIFVGESPYTKKLRMHISRLKPDGFKIKARKNWLAILGRDYGGKGIGTLERGTGWSSGGETGISMYGETGTLFGVYHFLETFCGVRWFMPGDLGEVVPEMPTIKISDTSISKAPFVDFRHLMAYYLFSADKEHVFWYRRAGFGCTYAGEIGHSFKIFDKWAKDHAEYFYLDKNGKPSAVKGQFLLYLNEPGVIKDVIAYIQKHFDEHPERRIFPLMPKDWSIIPEVPEEELTDSRYKGLRNHALGKNGNVSDYVWGFIDKVAKEVYKTHPDKLIGCCAYGGYKTPPPTLKRLSPNVAVMICMETAAHSNQEQRELFYKSVREWYKRSKHIYFWDYAGYYYTGQALPEMPVAYYHTVAREFRDLKNMLGNDWKGIYFEAECGVPQVRKFLHKEMLHLMYYVFARCLWDPDLDIDSLLNDYYEKFFGPAKEEMKKYYELAEKLWDEKTSKYKFTHVYWSFNLDYSPQEADQLVGHLKRAKEKADGTIYGKRVDLILKKVSGLQNKFAVTSKYPCVPLGKKEGIVKEEGLLAYWQFDEGRGMITRDSTGNGNHGLVCNADWLYTDCGSALQFNGKDSCVEIYRPKNLQPKRHITVMGWFFFESTGRTGLIWTGDYAYLLGIGRGIQFRFHPFARTFGFSTRYLNVPGWNHIAGTHDDKKLRMYLNGELKCEQRGLGNIRYGKKFKVYIGAMDFNTKSQRSFKGRIDEVKIYSRALSAEEIKAEFERGKEAFEKVGSLENYASIPARKEGGKNLVPNGDFEEGEMDEYVGRIVPGWRLIGKNAKDIKPHIHLDEEVAISGERALRIESGLNIYSNTISLKHGHVYLLSLWAKGDGTSPRIGIMGLESCMAGGVPKGFWLKPIRGLAVPEEWKQYSMTVVTPSEGDPYYYPERRFYVRIGSGGGGIIWVDRVSLMELE